MKKTASPKPKTDTAKKYKWTAKRIIALIAVILLAGLYIVTFISACLSSPGSERLFRFCLAMTIAVPLIAWILLWAVGKFRPAADPDEKAK